MASASYLAPTSTWLFSLPGVGEPEQEEPGGRKSRRQSSSQLEQSGSAMGNSIASAGGSFDMSWVLAGTMPAELLGDDTDGAVQIVKAAQREKAAKAAAKEAERKARRESRRAAAQEKKAAHHAALAQQRAERAQEELLGGLFWQVREQAHFGYRSGGYRLQRDVTDKWTAENEEAFERAAKSMERWACFYFPGHSYTMWPTAIKKDEFETLLLGDSLATEGGGEGGGGGLGGSGPKIVEDWLENADPGGALLDKTCLDIKAALQLDSNMPNKQAVEAAHLALGQAAAAAGNAELAAAHFNKEENAKVPLRQQAAALGKECEERGHSVASPTAALIDPAVVAEVAQDGAHALLCRWYTLSSDSGLYELQPPSTDEGPSLEQKKHDLQARVAAELAAAGAQVAAERGKAVADKEAHIERVRSPLVATVARTKAKADADVEDDDAWTLLKEQQAELAELTTSLAAEKAQFEEDLDARLTARLAGQQEQLAEKEAAEFTALEIEHEEQTADRRLKRGAAGDQWWYNNFLPMQAALRFASDPANPDNAECSEKYFLEEPDGEGVSLKATLQELETVVGVDIGSLDRALLEAQWTQVETSIRAERRQAGVCQRVAATAKAAGRAAGRRVQDAGAPADPSRPQAVAFADQVLARAAARA
eukprot:SAG22_NODE_2090_length_3027_cov_16.257855_1_plen_652_part_01